MYKLIMLSHAYQQSSVTADARSLSSPSTGASRDRLFHPLFGQGRLSKAAFTLIELLVVIAIVAVLASLVSANADGTDVSGQMNLGLNATAGTKVTAPVDMIAVGDSTVLSLTHASLSPVALLVIDGRPLGAFPADRHNSRANILFCDEHVESLSNKQLLESSASSRRRWNIDNEPHPETWQESQ